jgi:undecaprenyl-phosphate 4-deoxy-4-formamido-L-arabinose transferase
VLYAVVAVQRTIASDYRGGIAALWDRDILEFFLIGVLLFGVGLVGEYVGRIYQQVRDRPRYTIRAVLERDEIPVEMPTDRWRSEARDAPRSGSR